MMTRKILKKVILLFLTIIFILTTTSLAFAEQQSTNSELDFYNTLLTEVKQT